MSIDNPSLDQQQEAGGAYVPNLKVEKTLAELEGELARRNTEVERGRTGPDESGKIHALERLIAEKKAVETSRPAASETTREGLKSTPPPGSLLERVMKLKNRKNESRLEM